MNNAFYEVSQVLENYAAAVYELDVEKFLAAYHEDIHLYDCWGRWELQGLPAWRESVAEWFSGIREDNNVVNVTFDDVVITEDANTAFIHCAVTFTGYEAGGSEPLRQMTNRFTFGLKKSEESWQIAHEHSSLPIDLETGNALYDSKA
ncbi:DUF4440 domain-containing protein [Chryseomicrobium excrementi]|uniref:DUF4440 domain-containing protein n=1 Tax=Chryseomicrobium excrementi TaxID=2041346 RepID=A0A2M9EY87_9BACL|nr:nuclear transport factor 2 family protein [Chryseomicrobium excrementi]PJK16175.1 DUF4440 domain-containing protein [Chryseomicrobium excrementi]